ncbi:nuclear RNA export factor 2-like [Talpa occidentalis]|uniref:nuclear RNA export factor 2-like n=1 Tax=Talpa occidentalis TaxID=50954 RepID=UPI00188E8144|nr:nuclear RNA export factor 2-like [Talpa occidentalis]
MRDGQEDPEVRHSPYGNRWNKRRVKPQNEDGIHINVWRERTSAERETGKKKQDETLGNWFKIIVPSGIKYDKSWLMDSLRTHCRVPFTPVDFHYVKNQAQFFVQDARAAAALKDISYKISDEDNRKICIFSNKSAVPRSVKNMLKAEELEHLELTMNKRYDDCQQSLDLQRLRYDPDLVGRDIDIILNRRNCMAATLQIIQKTFPQLLSLNLCNNKLYRLDGLSDIVQMVPTVKRLNLSRNMLKSTWEVNKIKGLKLDELWLDGNPLCDTFPDRATYVSAIRAFFPTLLRLDGKEVTPQVAVDTGIPSLIKPCKESYEGSETLKNLVLHFLQQYFWIYDYGDRQGLLGAYHEQACFSLTVPFSPEDPAPNMWQYFRDSRNIIKLKDPYTRYQLLRHTSPEIVSTLCVLPQTQHDLGSFLVDLWPTR